MSTENRQAGRPVAGEQPAVAAPDFNRKIDPSRMPPSASGEGSADVSAGQPALKPDGSPADNDRVEIGPTQLAFDEWARAGIQVPNLELMRQHRLSRIVAGLHERDLAGVLLFDPLNIRYATDSSNMQLWNTHNPFRACLVMADAHMLIWDYHGIGFLSAHNPLVREVRTGADFFYFDSGDRVSEKAREFVDDVDELLREHCGSNRRLGVDKIMIHGLRALDDIGIEVKDGEELMEKTRAIKGEHDIHALRCAVHSCEQAMHEMERQAQPGMTENDIWAVLHAENIRRGGEWIETRLLSSGPRTNPWFQESGPRIVQNNELVAFDTDMIGCYGMCCDISRTWFVGDAEPTAEQRRLYREAYTQIRHNMQVLAPGKTIGQVVSELRPLSEDIAPLRYGCAMHGVGLCDEWPLIKYPNDFTTGEFDYPLSPGMVLCVEAYVGVVGGADGIKLEDQVLITDDGHECLSAYPFDQKLLA